MIPKRPNLRIILAEDHALLREAWRLLIDQLSGIELVGIASDGVEAVSLSIELIPDLALLDWKMPRLNGLETAQEIKRNVSSVKNLVFSSSSFEIAILDGLDNGVDGFLQTDVGLETLGRAIRSICEGQRYLSAEATTALLNARRPTSDGYEEEGLKLSSRELEVLRLMATPATYADMARELIIGETTVRTYVRRIFAKLQQPNRTSAVVEGIRRNLIRIDPTTTSDLDNS